MQNLKPIIAASRAALVKNSPAILAGIGAVGVIATAVATHKAATTAWVLSQESAIVKGEDLTPREYLEATWRAYIPAALTATIAVSAVIGSQMVSAGRVAALTAACGVAEKAADDYKEKIREALTKGQESKVREGVALERVNNDFDKSEILSTGKGEVLCYEAVSGRFFRSDIEAVRKAANDFNAGLIRETFLSVNHWWSLLGIGVTKYGEVMGWNADRLLELEITAVVAPNGEPALEIDYFHGPSVTYDRMF